MSLNASQVFVGIHGRQVVVSDDGTIYEARWSSIVPRGGPRYEVSLEVTMQCCLKCRRATEKMVEVVD